MDNKEFREDDYLVTSKYAGRGRSEAHPNFSTFDYEGEYYFAYLDADEAVALRSEGYKSPEGRDNGILSVQKNMTIPERWSIVDFMNKYFISLKAGNNQEIAKSGAFNSKEEAEAYLTKIAASSSKESSILSAAGGAIITGKIISETRNKVNETRNVISETRNDLGEKSRSQIGETRNVIGETRTEIGENRRVLGANALTAKEERYLPCQSYKGHDIVDKDNRVAFFIGKDKKLYFAIYNLDGTVRLRSEGFESPQKRDSELADALKNIDDESKYQVLDKGDFHVKVLKNEAGDEVGRTCLQEGAGAIGAMALAGVAAMTVSKFEAPAKKEKGAYVSNGGCLKFWPLLLLLPLLWFCWKGCGAAPVPPPAAVVESPPPPPPVKETVPPPPPPPKKCDCSKLKHPVFVLPDGPPPKETTILGRAPEYGNSHSLNASGFYNKLKNKYASSARERQFLDDIFKEMGYENGFKDATADLFTEVTVPRGVDGNLGTKVSHKTVYRKLNTKGKDLLAFRIKAENACDLHFMKTCGNHFFYNDCE